MANEFKKFGKFCPLSGIFLYPLFLGLAATAASEKSAKNMKTKEEVHSDALSTSNGQKAPSRPVLVPRPGSRIARQENVAAAKHDPLGPGVLTGQQRSTQATDVPPIEAEVARELAPMGRNLSPKERAELEQHETKVSLGVASVGEELRAIRDKRLYREKFTTFEDYVEKRWNYSRSRAYQLINIAEVSAVLCSVQAPSDLNERQMRELAGLSANEMKQVLGQATSDAGNEPLTASKIRAARTVLLGRSEEPEQNALSNQPERIPATQATGAEDREVKASLERCVGLLDEELAAYEQGRKLKLVDALGRWLRKKKQQLESA